MSGMIDFFVDFHLVLCYLFVMSMKNEMVSFEWLTSVLSV